MGMRHYQNSGLHPRALGLGHQALTSGLPLAVDLTYQIKQPLFYVKVGYYQLHGAINKEERERRQQHGILPVLSTPTTNCRQKQKGHRDCKICLLGLFVERVKSESVSVLL